MARLAIRAFVFPLALMMLGAVTARAQAPAGPAFVVNTATTASALFPEAAVDAEGNFLVAWVNIGQPDTLRAQLFDSHGGRRGGEFQVNAATTDDAFFFGVSAFANGDFVVVWDESSTAESRLRGRVVDRAGSFKGAEFDLTSTPQSGDPAVATAGSAGFVVAWDAFGVDGSASAVLARRFDSAGRPLTPELVVNTYTSGFQYAASVAEAEDGSFVVVWSEFFASEGGRQGVFGQRFDRAGARAGGEFRIDSATSGRAQQAEVTGDGRGRFVVAWQQEPESGLASTHVRRFDAGGAPLGPELVVNSFTTTAAYYASLASDRAGNFTVVWNQDTALARTLFARRYHADGSPRGAVFQVSADTTERQGDPAVATDGTGNLLVAWHTSHVPFDGQDVKARRFGGLFPAGLGVADPDNGVLEAAEDFTLLTSWRNASGVPQTLQGTSSALEIALPLTLSLSAQATYDTVAEGGVASCGAACFTGRVDGTRAPGHVDLAFTETLAPESQGQAKRWRAHVGGSFTDVPRASPFYRYVETLLHRGVTAGCGGNAYCPGASTSREQMATFVLTAKEGSGYAPAPCGTPLFEDVPASSPFCPWIEDLARRGVVAGCGPAAFCPGAAVARQEMAVFTLRTLDSALDPPPCGTPLFEDVPASSPFCRWIEELARRGVVAGCGGTRFCPTAAVTREQMAVFLGAVFGLTLYGP